MVLEIKMNRGCGPRSLSRIRISPCGPPTQPPRHVPAILLVNYPTLFPKMRLFQNDNHEVKYQPEQHAVTGYRQRPEHQRLAEHGQQNTQVHRIAREAVRSLRHYLRRLLAQNKPLRASEEYSRRPTRSKEPEQALAIHVCTKDDQYPTNAPQAAYSAAPATKHVRQVTPDNTRHQKGKYDASDPQG